MNLNLHSLLSRFCLLPCRGLCLTFNRSVLSYIKLLIPVDTSPTVTENPLYERGPDGQLVVRSRASSASSRQFQGVDVTAQLGSQDFLLANISRATSHDMYPSRPASASSEEPRMDTSVSGQQQHSQEEQDIVPAPTQGPGSDGYEAALPVAETRDPAPFKNIYQSLKKLRPASGGEVSEGICTLMMQVTQQISSF